MDAKANFGKSEENALGDSFTHSFEDRTLLDYLLEGHPEINPDDEPFCHHYLEQLSSYGLSKLASEPEHLKEKQANILASTQTLAYENYQTFIQAAECSKEVYRDFTIVETHLDSVVENLPIFRNTGEEFSKRSQEINACRKQNSLVLSRHTQLLEILEIPQLMDTCVRNGYYEEALELSNFVKRLEKKFASIKIITEIGSEVKRSRELMLNQLLQQLKVNIQLPACLRIISYIRQLDVFTEKELRITFLQARDSWFKSVLNQIPTDDAYTRLSKVIESSRVNLFDIITQYKAIFSDDEPSYTADSQRCIHYSSILHSWVIRKISDFMKTLQEDINRGLGGRLDSVYAQCMYFGLSFSRIRADFRAVIVSIFHRHVLQQFKMAINNATHKFEDEMSTFSISSKNFKRNTGNETRKSSKDPCIPPHELLDFPPLASYLNGFLNALNDLRQYAALPLVFQVKETMVTSLEKVMIYLQNWARLESHSQLTKSSEGVEQICLVVCKYFLPYVNQALKLFFKPEKLREMIGRIPTNADSKSVHSRCYVDVCVLSKYLKDFVDIDILTHFDESVSYTEEPSVNSDATRKIDTVDIPLQSSSEHSPPTSPVENGVDVNEVEGECNGGNYSVEEAHENRKGDNNSAIKESGNSGDNCNSIADDRNSMDQSASVTINKNNDGDYTSSDISDKKSGDNVLVVDKHVNPNTVQMNGMEIT